MLRPPSSQSTAYVPPLERCWVPKHSASTRVHHASTRVHPLVPRQSVEDCATECTLPPPPPLACTRHCAASVHVLRGGADNAACFVYKSSQATLVDFHVARCHAVAGNAGLEVSASARAVMIRGSVTRCTSQYGVGFVVRGYSVLSLIDVRVVECATTGLGSENEGGGIYVADSMFNMTGGGVIDCNSFNGGGLQIKGADALAHIRGTTVRGCNAHKEGGGINLDGGYLSLAEVVIEDCVATEYGGGFIQSYNLESTVIADHVRIVRCHTVSHPAGALFLAFTGTWTDCIFSDCTNGRDGNVFVSNGGFKAMFIRCLILHCHSLGNGALAGRGGGFGMDVGTAIMVDSSIVGCTARDSGGCISLQSGTAVLRNTTLSSCSAPDGPYMRMETSGAATSFVSELLTLEPACEEEHSGALITITDEFTATLNVRGLQVSACASSNLSVVSEQVRLARCSDGDVCGDAANCADVVPLPSAPNLTTADCSCQGEFFPNPAGTSLALAPYGFVPSSVGLSGASIDYCVRWCRLESAQRQTCYSRPFTPRCRSPLASPPRPLSAASLSRP